MDIICVRVKELRTKENLTQKQLAQLLGTSISAISSYEIGVAYPPVETIRKLCMLFHVTTDYLLGLNQSQWYWM